MNPIVLASGLGKIDAIALHISDVAARADPGLLIPACWSRLSERVGIKGAIGRWRRAVHSRQPFPNTLPETN